MPKKPDFLASERVDVPDFLEAARNYTDALAQEVSLKQLQSNKALALEGFRVEIADQSISPGQVTVFNGYALDRSGRVLTNEESATDSRSVVLAGSSTTFYIEVQYAEKSTDTDARAFWDPDATNANSGLTGREFYLSVPTRITPDWEIVTPVSTSGFDATTNPNSNKLPVMILVTDSGGLVDTAMSGLVQVTAASVLAEDVSLGATKLRLLNTRLFPASSSVLVDYGNSPETKALNANDTENNILTLATPLAADHLAGAIVKVTGVVARYVQERERPIPTVPGHPDVTKRFFQADEYRGRALVQSTADIAERNDLSIRSLKDQLDAQAAVIREMKFGAMRPDTDSYAPPADFRLSPRWVDAAGGLQGGRMASVSVGNGSTSWGDFNGADEETFNAAIASLPTTGGILFVKRGNYVLQASNVITDKNVWVIGEDRDGTKITIDSDVSPLFSLVCTDPTDINTDVTFSNIQLVQNGDALLIASTASKFIIENCTCRGRIVSAQQSNVPSSSWFAARGSYITSGLNSVNGEVLSISGSRTVEITDCQVYGSPATATNVSCIYLQSDVKSVRLTNLYLAAKGNGSCIRVAADAAFESVYINNITGEGDTGPFLDSGLTATCKNFILENITLGRDSAIALDLSSVLHVINPPICYNGVIRNIQNSPTHPITASSTSTGFSFIKIAPNALVDGGECSLLVENVYCVVDTGYVCDLISVVAANDYSDVDLNVKNCRLFGGRRGVYIDALGRVVVEGCTIAGGTKALAGVWLRAKRDGSHALTVRDNTILSQGAGVAGGTVASGVYVQGDAAATTNRVDLAVTNSRISSVGSPGITQASGVYVAANVKLRDLTITHNNISGITADTGGAIACGVLVVCEPDATSNKWVVKDNDIKSIGAADDTSAFSYAVAVYDATALTQVDIRGNTVHTVYGASSTSGAVYLSAETLDRCRVDNNTVAVIRGDSTTLTGGMIKIVTARFRRLSVSGNELIVSSGTEYLGGAPIYVELTSAGANVSVGLTIANNNVGCSGSTYYGIKVIGTSANPTLKNVSITGNNISGLASVGGVSGRISGIFCKFDGESLAVTGNTVEETVFNDERIGVYVGSFSSGLNFVSVTGNVLRGADGLRYFTSTGGVGVLFEDVNYGSITGNTVRWFDVALNGGDISQAIGLKNCGLISVSGNLALGGAGGSSAIIFESDTDHCSATGNIIGYFGALGTIVDLGTNNSAEVGSTLAITNKDS